MSARTTAIAFVVFLALAGLLAAELRLDSWLVAGPPKSLPSTGASASAANGTDPGGEGDRWQWQLPPIEVLNHTVERPLFSADRRPPAESVAAPVIDRGPSKQRLNFVLSAVVIADGERVAYLRDPGSNKLSRLREGDRIGPWALEAVHPDRVIMVAGEQEEAIDLRTFQAPALPPKQRTREPASTPPKATKQGVEEDDADLRRPRRPKRGPRQDSLKRLRQRQPQDS